MLNCSYYYLVPIFFILIISLTQNVGAYQKRQNSLDIRKIGSNIALNDHVDVPGSQIGIFNLDDTNYLSIWAELNPTNLTLNIHTINTSDMTYGNVTKKILPYEGFVYTIKATRLSDNNLAVTWRHDLGPNNYSITGQFIHSSLNSTKFVDDSIRVTNSTNPLGNYDIKAMNNSIFTISGLDSDPLISGSVITVKSFRYVGTSNSITLLEIGTGHRILPVFRGRFIGPNIGNRFMIGVQKYGVPNQITANVYEIDADNTTNIAQSLPLSPVDPYIDLVDIIELNGIWVVFWKYSIPNPPDYRLICTGFDSNGSIVINSFEVYKISSQAISISKIGSNRFIVTNNISPSQGIFFKVIERKWNQFITILDETRIDASRSVSRSDISISVGGVNGFGISWTEQGTTTKSYVQFYDILNDVTGSISNGGPTPSPDEMTDSDSTDSSVLIIIIVLIVTISICILIAGILFLMRNRHIVSDTPEVDEGLKSVRMEKTRTKILERYSLIDKINRQEAEDLEEQVGIHINFPKNINKVFYLVGEGAGGKVRLALDEQSNTYVGVKKLKDTDTIKRFEHEHAIQLELKHPNILTLLDVVRTHGSQGQPVEYLFMELFMMDGSLFSRIINKSFENASKVKESIILYVFRNIISGIAYMHRSGYYHRDLKLSNVLIGKHGEVKIIDFGHSVRLDDGMINHPAGDISTFSPECNELLKQPVSNRGQIDAGKNDVWSVGLALLETIIGRYPLDRLPLNEMLNRDISYYGKVLTPIFCELDPNNFSTAIIKSTMQIDPKNRISIEYLERMFVDIPNNSSDEHFVLLIRMYLETMTKTNETGQIYASNTDNELPPDYMGPVGDDANVKPIYGGVDSMTPMYGGVESESPMYGGVDSVRSAPDTYRNESDMYQNND
jgi:serine/threonine protein kinase